MSSPSNSSQKVKVKLKSYLEKKSLNVVSCEKLTKFEEARTHSYKVTAKASEFEKAKNPELWTYIVGVRLILEVD